MRLAPPAALLSLFLPLAVVIVPVATLPHAAPHPVTPQVRSQPLRGVDLGGVGSGARRASARAAFAAAHQAGGPAARRGGPVRPDVLVSRRHVARFDLLGVNWARGGRSDLTVLVRAHGAKGWSGWTALDAADRPTRREGRPARLGTEPLWVGDSDGYQVRVDVRRGALPRGLRVDLVDPGRSDADDEVGARSPPSTAQAAAGRPAIFTRSDWGADERMRTTAPRYNTTVRAGFVHHTAGTNNYTAGEVPRILRGIYAYHVRGNGWSDIGYNFLVDRFGRLWEGRYGGMDRAVVGAHTGGFNVDSFAVSAIGNYDRKAAPPAMVDSIARVMAWKLSLSYRDPNGTTALTSQGGGTSKYRAGTRVTFNVISGHRDAGNTSCPGSNLYAQLATIRSLTTSYLGTAIIEPQAQPTTAVFGRSVPITTTARVTTDQQWRLEVRDVCRGTVVRALTGTASPTVPISAVWDLRDDTGTAVRPGAYELTLTSADALAPAQTWASQVTLNAASTTPPPATVAALPGPSSFVPVDPVKLYDTHESGNLPLGPHGRVDLELPGAGPLPADGIGAVALTISSTCATSDTTLTAWAAGSRKPPSAAVRVLAGSTASALAVAPLSGDGTVSVGNWHGTTEVEVHVVGYYPVQGGGVFRPMRALRLYDSRRDPAGILTPGADRVVTMPTLKGIPASAMTGAMLSVTSSSATGTGTVTAQSTATARSATTVAFHPGSAAKDRAVVRLQDGQFKLTAHGASTHVSVDVVGWWTLPEVASGRLFQAHASTRVIDTRAGIGVRAGRIGPGGVVNVKVAGRHRAAPAGAKAVVMTLTARGATRRTFVTAWPRGGSRPAFPDLAVPAWRPTANLVVVKVGKQGRIKITNGSGYAHVVGDVVGYYP